MIRQPHPRAFFYALQFLTRIPAPLLPAPDSADLSRAALYYPLVGLFIGALLLIPALLLPAAESLLLAALLTVMWAAITGALHIDGLADSADAWLGGTANPARIHDILKDPLVGAAGVVAIACVLLLKFSALYALLQSQQYLPVLLAPLLGRSMILLLFTTTDYVRRQGLASEVVRNLNGRAALLLVAMGLIAAAWVSVPAMLCLLCVFYLLRRMMIRLIKGCTGDTAGATVEIGEATWLVAAALF
mgnify:CR=1 FL=1